MPEEKSLRRRVNVSVSVKGIVTWDCTIDATNFPEEDVLKESKSLVAALKAEYPVTLEVK